MFLPLTAGEKKTNQNKTKPKEQSDYLYKRDFLPLPKTQVKLKKIVFFKDKSNTQEEKLNTWAIEKLLKDKIFKKIKKLPK